MNLYVAHTSKCLFLVIDSPSITRVVSLYIGVVLAEGSVFDQLLIGFGSFPYVP